MASIPSRGERFCQPIANLGIVRQAGRSLQRGCPSAARKGKSRIDCANRLPNGNSQVKGPSVSELEIAAPSRINGRKQPATIYDVAKASGVSPSTVSRALNKPGRLNEATERRIRDVADELGYRINPMARALPTG